MAAVRGAAPGGVSRQELRAIRRVAALLSGGVLGAAGTDMVRTTLGSGPALPRAPPSASGSPGLHRAHAVHRAWVVGAHAALLQVTAVVCLQRGWQLSPARALGSTVPFPSGASDPHPHLPGLRLPALCCLEQRGPYWWGQPALACPSPTPGPCLGWGLTWKRPESARAWARVQGQSGSSSRNLGSWSSSSSQARHWFRAQATGSIRKSSPRCQASACSLLQSACTSL